MAFDLLLLQIILALALSFFLSLLLFRLSFTLNIFAFDCRHRCLIRYCEHAHLDCIVKSRNFCYANAPINKQQTAWPCALTCTHPSNEQRNASGCKHDGTRFSTSKTSRKSTTCVLFWHSTAQHEHDVCVVSLVQ